MTPSITFYESASWNPDLGYMLTAKVDDARVEFLITLLVFKDHFKIENPNLQNTQVVFRQNRHKFERIFCEMIIAANYSAPHKVTLGTDNYQAWSSKHGPDTKTS